jgi:murein L,D-transpeptidase YcbB/YkuD
MRRFLCLLAPLALGGAAVPPPSVPQLLVLPLPASAPIWTPDRIAALGRWVAAAPADALPVPATTELDAALASHRPEEIDRAASALALRLARLHLLGVDGAAARVGWHIIDTDARIDLPVRLAQALAVPGATPAGQLDRFFTDLRPQNPDYAVLRAAFATETDPVRRATLARNMERWRWLPSSPGSAYLIVNAASFEVSLWRQGRRVGTWPVIVGKPRSPTPVFSTIVTGVTLNPWWEVPPSIARESVAALVRRHPALAAKRGFVHAGARYRQAPGPANSLGRMKLAMVDPYNVYLHDTPDKKLFAREVRAFSHGCIRVGDALGFAATLLQGRMSAQEIDAVVAGGRTTTVALTAPLPVYVTYFTAAVAPDGTVRLLPDVYGRDSGAAVPPNRTCAG